MKHHYFKFPFLLILSTFFSMTISAQNWQHLPVFPSSIFNGFDYVRAIAIDDQNIYAVSHLGEIAVSSDGGQNWTENTPASIGFGEFGALESNGSELYLYDQGYGFNPEPRIFISNDNGTSFTLDSAGYQGNILKPEFQFVNSNWWLSYDRNKGYLPRAPYRYNSANNQWEEKSNAPEAQDICEAKDSLFAINNQAQLIKSSDNGENWRTISSPFPNALMSCLVSNNDTLFILSRDVASQDCFFSFSADEGSTWTTTDLSAFQIPGTFNRLVFYLLAVDGDFITITSLDNNAQDSSAHILTSLDRGASFQADSFTVYSPFSSVHEVYQKGSNSYILIDDRIYSNASGSSSGVHLSENKLHEISLYPNPCENTLNLNTLDEREAISILDTKGRLRISKGENSSKSIDVSELEPGVYILKQGQNYGRFIKR